jgi:hypothetical protein
MTEHITRQMRRRSAVEPVIGHLKARHRMGRSYLAGRAGDAANAVLAAAGYNFRRLIALAEGFVVPGLGALGARNLGNLSNRASLIGILHGRLTTGSNLDKILRSWTSAVARSAGRAPAQVDLASNNQTCISSDHTRITKRTQFSDEA